jgi:hypothetical protein
MKKRKEEKITSVGVREIWAVFAKWETFGGWREQQFVVFEDNLRNCWTFGFHNVVNGVPLKYNTLLLIFNFTKPLSLSQ